MKKLHELSDKAQRKAIKTIADESHVLEKSLIL